ncbi:MAG: hypothetical protein LUC48_11900 [Clostridiales bacterium]|nr:hypothetical protein [Clostridiales bacterium]
MDYETLSEGFENLWESILANNWPSTFCNNVLGMTASTGEALHSWMEAYLLLYALCTASALTLRVFQKQKPLTSWPRKLINAALMLVLVPLLQLLGSTVQTALARFGAVEGSFSFSDDGILWLWRVARAIFAPVLVGVVVLLLLALPVSAAIDYVQRYKGAGIAWLIFDVGLGPAILSAMCLSMYYEDRRWYLVIILALAATCLGQIGGHVNPRQERKKGAAAAAQK